MSKQRMDRETFGRRLSLRASEVAAIHGPEGMEVRVGEFADEDCYGIAAKFSNNVKHGVRLWPWEHHNPKPEEHAWHAVMMLIAWWRKKYGRLDS